MDRINQILHEILGDLNPELTAFSLENSPFSTELDEDPHPKDLQEAQTQDVDLKQVKIWVLEQSLPPRPHLQGFNRNVWKPWNLIDEVTIDNNILCRKFGNPQTSTKIFQQVVPPLLVPEILHSLHLHSDRTSAHLGETKTLEKLRYRFYWPGHKRDVEVFFGNCLVCQKPNSHSKKHIHCLRVWEPSFPFSTVGFDFFGPLPLSSGHQYFLLKGDHFTKWHEAVALPNQSASTAASALLEHWLTRFGCPERIHSDQGRNFEAQFFKSLIQLLQIDKTRTTAFHPQSNAVIERTSRTLLNVLAKSTDTHQQN